MNSFFPLVLLFPVAVLPASAITDAEITPAALIGKKLIFSIENGGAPYATTGTWSGTFSANQFTAEKITGDFVNITSTYTATVDREFVNFALSKFVKGRPPATLTLYTFAGVGHYEANIQGVFDVSLNGLFTIAPAANGKISIIKPDGGNLSDGSKFAFGPAKTGTKGISKVFTIRNTGTAKLTGLTIRKSGTHQKDFVISKLGKTTLAPKESAQFKVTFRPSAKGSRKAQLRITGTDLGKGDVDILLTGRGTK